jgi:hypothetical protein
MAMTEPTDADVHSFLEAFAANFNDPNSRFGDLMHEGATLLTAGGTRPLTFEEGEKFVAGVKRVIPDISLRVKDWAVRGTTVFTEWEMTGTLAGRTVRWAGINRNTLDGAKSRRAISCWDRYSLLEQFDSSHPRLELGAELARLAEKAGKVRSS